MNKEKQRIAIAEAAGWTKCGRYTGTTGIRGQRIGTPLGCLSLVPDYLEDLNAMREAWETLSPTLQTAFSSVLFDVCGCWHAAANATAEQRAKAFLLVVGKWEDA